MEGKQVVLMEQQRLSPGLPEDSESESESASDSYVYSESVASVNIAGCSEPKPSLVSSSPRRRNKQGDLQFLHFTKELPDVPVQKAWTFIRGHKMMASLVPGLIEEFDFIEGEGGTGSIYIAYYNPKCHIATRKAFKCMGNEMVTKTRMKLLLCFLGDQSAQLLHA